MAEHLHRDQEGGCIVLIRMPGDCWRVARNQNECDWVRNTETQSSTKTRLGVCGFQEDCQFVRVRRIAEEPIT